MPKLREESNDAIVFVCFPLCVAIHLMDRIDVIVSCMIIREPMSLLKPLYRDCVGMASHVHSGTHSSSVCGVARQALMEKGPEFESAFGARP